MALITDKTIFYVNGRNRQSGDESDFLYQIQIPKETKYDMCCVLQMSIPKSYYLIQTGEYFQLVENKTTVNISIATGNYTRKSLAATVASALTSGSPNGWVYVITYDTSSTSVDTGKYTFTVTGNGGIQPQFIFLTDNDINRHLGFVDGSTNTFIGDSLVSTNVINIQRDSILYLHSNMANNGPDDVLQEVFSDNSADYSNIVFQQQDVEAYSKKLTSSSNNVYKFTLTDEAGKKIDLNGQNINFTFVLYKKNNIYDMINNFLKLKVLGK